MSIFRHYHQFFRPLRYTPLNQQEFIYVKNIEYSEPVQYEKSKSLYITDPSGQEIELS